MAKPNLIDIIDSKINKDYVYEMITATLNTYDLIVNTYTKDEIDSFLNLKSHIEHSHTEYYDINQIEDFLNELKESISEKSEIIHYHDDLYVTKEALENLERDDLGGITTGEDANGIQIIYRGGTESEHENFIGAEKEITVDTTNWTLRIHDGITPGGHMINCSGEGGTNNNSNGTIVSGSEPIEHVEGGIWIDIS